MELFKRRNFYYWMLQIGGWTFFVAFIVMLNFIVDKQETFNKNTMLGLLFFLFINIAISHLVRVAIKFFGGLPQHILKFLWISILISFVFGVVSASLLFAVDKTFGIPNSHDYWSYILNNAIGLGLLKFIWLLIYFGFHLYERIQEQRILNLKLEAAKNESELLSLRRQLNPHFIFNALNSVKALVEDDPNKAKQAITKISNILRTTLTTNKDHFVSLKVELELVEAYLGLEQIRFEERLKFNVHCDASLKNFVVPPFSIQNLVENAIKHGISKLALGGEVKVEITDNNNQLDIRVWNTGKLIKNAPSTNIGVENVNKRLGLLFDHYFFQLTQQEDLVLAEIKIPKKTML